MAWNEGQPELLREMLEVGPSEGEAQALPGAGEGNPSGLSYQFWGLLPNGPVGFI